jgi:hypothetical protein
MIYIGEVIDIEDPQGGDRIKVRLKPGDKWKSDEEVDYAFPLLPKHLHVKPKVGEAVLVISAIDGIQATQRYYIGPIISQPQDMFYDDYQFGATALLKRSMTKPQQSVAQDATAEGALAKPDEVAIYSRQNSDVVLSNNDVRIRCGSRLLKPMLGNQNSSNIEFNKKNPAFIKLKYHETPLTNTLQPRTPDSMSTATIVADEIALLSHKSKDPLFGGNELVNTDEQITDENLQKIINEAHVLPYGDTLVDFLMAFLQMFKSHTHKYNNDRPCRDEYADALDMQFGQGTKAKGKNDTFDKVTGGTPIENVGSTFSGLYDKLLSKNVRIN